MPAERAASLDTEKQPKTSVRNWLQKSLTQPEIDWQNEALHRRVKQTLFEIWQRYDRAGNLDQARKWQKQWMQVNDCQTQWIGYRADCCGSSTRPRAVPIGCNHRLCPLCCWHRSQRARKRIKCMFDRLEHPVMITLTVPNSGSIRKHDFTLIRQRVRKLIAQHKGWIRGGVYSLETTYNWREKTWHLHCHILADVACALPSKSDKVIMAGRTIYRFTAMKLRLEFDWLRLTQKGWGSKARANAGGETRLRDEAAFEGWVRRGYENRVREMRAGKWLEIDLPPQVREERTSWNRANRRVIHIAPVDDREKAALEVLKYITKVSAFADCEEAVEAFMPAVRGARLIQTFGSWYGVKIEPEQEPKKASDLQCTCGCNDWKRLGIFFRSDVEWSETAGAYLLRTPHDHNTRGTVYRPRIKALAGRET